MDCGWIQGMAQYYVGAAHKEILDGTTDGHRFTLMRRLIPVRSMMVTPSRVI